MKKILIIAYYFPPIGGGGVQRAMKMARYLPDFGYDVHVLTVEPAYHATLDTSLLEEIPSWVKVHRVPEPRGIVSQLKTLLRPAPPSTGRIVVMQTGGHITPTKGPEPTKLQSKPAEVSLKAKLFAFAKKAKAGVMIPDDQIVWRKAAVARGLELLAEHDFDAIVSTSGPYTNHLVAQQLIRIARRKAKKAGRAARAPKWIADFRDPWTQNMHRSGIAWREQLEEQMERSVHREADVTLTVTETFADNFKQKYPREISRVEVIHNGFDPADYANLNRYRADESKCVLMYAGIFYKERNPRLLLQAIDALIREGHIDRAKIQLKFAGVLDYPGYTDNVDEIVRLGLQDIVEAPGNLPHKRALAEMKNSDILLLIADTAPDSGAYIPGKLFEYMAIGTPILALSMAGESTKIIEKFGLGVVASPTDLSEIKNAVLQLYTQWQNGSAIATSAQDTRTLPYQRREQARLLADLVRAINNER